MKKYKNLFLLIVIFSIVAYIGIKFPVFGAFLAGLYLINGVAHFGYGITGFGKMTPKNLFGEEKAIHSIWGLCNFALSFALIYLSLETHWFAFIAGVLITILLLPLVANKERVKK